MEVKCPNCAKQLRVADDAANKRIRCPACQSIISLAGASPEVALPSPQAMAPRPAPANWTVKTETGQQYGPISKADLDRWVAEGRIGNQCQLLQAGAAQWQWASDVYPQLASAAAPPPMRGPSEPPYMAAPKPDADGGPFNFTNNPYAPPHADVGLASIRARSVPNHLPLAIFSLLCCGGIFAIPAIIYAAQANSMKAKGDYVGAARAASTAQTWLYVAIGIGVVANILGGLIQIAAMNAR
jgi:hypothetical protein